MTTGEIIQNKRKQFGWSQDQLADRLGITRQSISKWEQDLALPDLENGSKLCMIFGMSVEQLIHPSTFDHTNQGPQLNSSHSTQRFFKKGWNYVGLFITMIGVLVIVSGALFQMIIKAMNNQAQSSWEGMFGGFPDLFPSIRNSNVFNTLTSLSLWVGLFIILVGLGIFIAGRFGKKQI